MSEPIQGIGRPREFDWQEHQTTNPFELLNLLAEMLLDDFPPDPDSLSEPDRPVDSIGWRADLIMLVNRWDSAMSDARRLTIPAGLSFERADSVLRKAMELFTE